MVEQEKIKLDCTLSEDGTVTCGIAKDDLKKVVEAEISPQHVILTGKDEQGKSEEKPAEPKKPDIPSKPETSSVCSKTDRNKLQNMENKDETTPEEVDSSQSEDKSSTSDQKIVNNNQKLGEELTQKIGELIKTYLTKDNGNNQA